MNSGKNNEFPELKRWGRWGLGGGAIREPEGIDINDCPPSERKKHGFPGFHEFHSLPSFGRLKGRTQRAVRIGTFLPHPFLNELEVSDAGGLRYHGQAIASSILEGEMAGTILARLTRPKSPALRPEWMGVFQAIQLERELTFSTLPLAILVQECHGTENPPCPKDGGKDPESCGGFYRWIRKAVEEPMATPEDWPLQLRLGGWVVSLRGRAWNHWLDHRDISSTRST